jgi:hypothetical protein
MRFRPSRGRERIVPGAVDRQYGADASPLATSVQPSSRLRIWRDPPRRCRRSQSSAVVLANRADCCSDKLPTGPPACSHCSPLCSPTERRRWVPDVGARREITVFVREHTLQNHELFSSVVCGGRSVNPVRTGTMVVVRATSPRHSKPHAHSRKRQATSDINRLIMVVLSLCRSAHAYFAGS